MNKMMKPEMEVVRFGAEDVIATSAPCEHDTANHVYLSMTVADTNGQKNVSFGTLYQYRNGSYVPPADLNTSIMGGNYSSLKANTWYHKEGNNWIECEDSYNHYFLSSSAN